MNEIERATRNMLRQRRVERRRRRIISRVETAVCVAGMAICLAVLLWLDWPAVVASFHG